MIQKIIQKLPVIGLVLTLSLATSGRIYPGSQASQPRLPELTFKRLLSDLQLVIVSTPYLGESMTIGLVVRYGSSFDPVDKGGLAQMVIRLLAKATQDRRGEDIRADLQALGATLEVRCDWDGMRFILHGQSARFERSLLLLYQIVGEAVFDDADFNRVKAETLAELDKPEDPRQKSRNTFEGALFRNTTYGRSPRGSKASINKITLGDVRLFYRRFLSPNVASLSVVSSAPAPMVMQKAARIWGVWVRQDEVPFTFLAPHPPSSRQIILEDDPSSPAAQFVLGGIFGRRDDPGYYAGALGVRILEERLTKVLPTSLLTAGIEGRRMSGPFYIQGQAAADHAVAEIQKILGVAEELREKLASEEEVRTEQQRWVDSFYKNLGTTESLCDLLMESELYRLGTNYLTTFPDLVRRSGPEAIREAAKEWVLPGGGALIYVRGPASVLKASLDLLGSVRSSP